jgi:hypothetical protein
MEQSSQSTGKEVQSPRISKPLAVDYDILRETPHYCDGTLGNPPHRKHPITQMYHAGDEWSGRSVKPRFRCSVCGFTGFSTVKLLPHPKPKH